MPIRGTMTRVVPKIRDVKHVAGVKAQLAELPDTLVDLLYEQLEAFLGKELLPGEHVELLLVDGQAVRLSFFVDTDGLLWIERLGL